MNHVVHLADVGNHFIKLAGITLDHYLGHFVEHQVLDLINLLLNSQLLVEYLPANYIFNVFLQFLHHPIEVFKSLLSVVRQIFVCKKEKNHFAFFNDWVLGEICGHLWGIVLLCIFKVIMSSLFTNILLMFK